MADLLDALRSELSRLEQQTETVKAAIAVYSGQSSAEPKKKGTMSTAARAKISNAQKARWANVRAKKAGKGKVKTKSVSIDKAKAS
jgi:hypothetical protein